MKQAFPTSLKSKEGNWVLMAIIVPRITHTGFFIRRRVFDICYERLENVFLQPVHDTSPRSSPDNMITTGQRDCIAKMVLFFDGTKTSEAVTCLCTRALLR